MRVWKKQGAVGLELGIAYRALGETSQNIATEVLVEAQQKYMPKHKSQISEAK